MTGLMCGMTWLQSKYIDEDDEDDELEEDGRGDAGQYQRMALGLRTKPKQASP